jgi:hypothetical protein
MHRVDIYVIGITGKIAHAISQSMLADEQFKAVDYLAECAEVMYAADVPSVLIDRIIEAAIEQGHVEYAMGITYGNSGAQMHPSITLYADCLKLVELLSIVG